MPGPPLGPCYHAAGWAARLRRQLFLTPARSAGFADIRAVRRGDGAGRVEPRPTPGPIIDGSYSGPRTELLPETKNMGLLSIAKAGDEKDHLELDDVVVPWSAAGSWLDSRQ